VTKLQNMKIRINNPEHSKEVQECLFKLGYMWNSQLFPTVWRAEDADNLFTYKSGKIYCAADTGQEYFVEHNNTEVTLEDLRAMLAEQCAGATKVGTVDIRPFSIDTTENQITFQELQELVSTTNIELTFQTNGKVHIYDYDTDTGKEFDSVEDAVLLLKAKAEYLKEWNKL
jgi:hypothetical protein